MPLLGYPMTLHYTRLFCPFANINLIASKLLISVDSTSFERLNLLVSDKAEIKLSADFRLNFKSVVKLLVAILIPPLVYILYNSIHIYSILYHYFFQWLCDIFSYIFYFLVFVIILSYFNT
nr:MAG TPA: hypothetical protein [Caudoviricetes sp.]